MKTILKADVDISMDISMDISVSMDQRYHLKNNQWLDLHKSQNIAGQTLKQINIFLSVIRFMILKVKTIK